MTHPRESHGQNKVDPWAELVYLGEDDAPITHLLQRRYYLHASSLHVGELHGDLLPQKPDHPGPVTHCYLPILTFRVASFCPAR